MEVERAVCFYLLWPQPWKGNTSNGRRLPLDARPSGQTFFGFLLQNMACYPGRSVSMGKTQFVLCTAGPTAGISTGQHISAGGFTSDYGREKETKQIYLSLGMCLQAVSYSHTSQIA